MKSANLKSKKIMPQMLLKSHFVSGVLFGMIEISHNSKITYLPIYFVMFFWGEEILRIMGTDKTSNSRFT